MKIWLLEESHPLQVPVSGDNRPPDVCVIELGGTIGDIEGTLCVCVCDFELGPWVLLETWFSSLALIQQQSC